LTGVNSVRVISGPDILRISVFVIPPGVFHVAKFQRGVITIVLNENLKSFENSFQFLLIKKKSFTLID
jgi:hypothetical protein